MKTIWKYAIHNGTTIHMPIGAEILCAQSQNGGLYIWAIVDPDAAYEYREFAVYGTGKILPDAPARYIDTVQWPSSVCHVFETTQRAEQAPYSPAGGTISVQVDISVGEPPPTAEQAVEMYQAARGAF